MAEAIDPSPDCLHGGIGPADGTLINALDQPRDDHSVGTMATGSRT